jgi:hypothetical protein
MNKKNKHIGSDFDDFLKEENILEETEAIASKRILAFELQQSMKEQHMTKTIMAKRMHTSRSAVERLFDPENESVTLSTLNRAASALGRRLRVELV